MAHMPSGTSCTNKMQVEPERQGIEQAVNKRRPISDEKRIVGPISPWSISTQQTDFTLTFPRNDKGSKIPKNNLIPGAVVRLQQRFRTRAEFHKARLVRCCPFQTSMEIFSIILTFHLKWNIGDIKNSCSWQVLFVWLWNIQWTHC